MIDDHFSILAECLRHLQGLLHSLFETLSRAGPTDGTARKPGVTGRGPDGAGQQGADPRPDSSTTWQDQSFQVLARMQEADLLVRSLLTSTNDPLPADQIIPLLRQALEQETEGHKTFGRGKH